MSLTPPSVPVVPARGAALHANAKASPDQRFHALYDKVYRKDVLEHAYECCRSNGGAEGVDGQKFEDIEAYGLGRWLDELAEEPPCRNYRRSTESCPKPCRVRRYSCGPFFTRGGPQEYLRTLHGFHPGCPVSIIVVYGTETQSIANMRSRGTFCRVSSIRNGICSWAYSCGLC